MKRTCEVCGTPTTLATRCTNDRCMPCHAEYCVTTDGPAGLHGRGSVSVRPAETAGGK